MGLSVELQAAVTTCTNPKLQFAHEWECQVVKPSCARQRETRGVELRRASTVELNSGTTVVAQLRCHGNSETASRVVFFRGEAVA